jgi:hypothetical protein
MIVDIAVFDLNSYDSFGGVVPIVVRKGAECTLVTIVPDTLAPGDTAAVLVMKRQTDGTVVPYPPETLFSVTLLAGQGTLIGPSGDTSSTMLECVEQGFRYVAPDSITGSSLETHISAVLAEGCGGLRSVGGQSAGKMKDKGEETPRLSLAECPVFASVVVEADGCEPICADQPIRYTIPDQRIDDQAVCNNYFYGVTETHLDLYDPVIWEVCFSTRNRWEPYAIEVKGEATWGLCSNSRGGRPIDINDANQANITSSNYRTVIEQLRIERDYFTTADYTYEPQYWSPNGVLTHEFEHVKDFRKEVRDAVEGRIPWLEKHGGGLKQRLRKVFAARNNPCDPVAAKITMDAQVQRVVNAFKLAVVEYQIHRSKTMRTITNAEKKRFRVTDLEYPAVIEASNFYNDLIKAIQVRFE